MLKAETITEKWFDSHCYGKLPRLDYIIDLLENYCPYFNEICQSGDHNIVVSYTSDTTSVTDAEKIRLRSFLSNHFSPGSNWQLLFATDNTLSNELALQFISFEHNPIYAE